MPPSSGTLPGLKRGERPNVIPIPGASRPESLTDSARATELTLAPDQVAGISDDALATARARAEA